MAIRRSSRADVQALIAELREHARHEARRETALARLALIGPRAVGHLLAALGATSAPSEQRALWMALERLPDPRAIDAVLTALEPSGTGAPNEDQSVRIAVLRAARPLLRAVANQTSLLERLTVIALDRHEAGGVRQAALDALGELPARTLAPIRRRLADDPDESISAWALGGQTQVSSAEERPAEDLEAGPDSVLAEVRSLGDTAPLPWLHALLERVRAREAASGRHQGDWRVVRGAIHVALARRDSRVALYDLREAFEATTSHPLPPDFPVAMQLVGDATCLEPLARAWLHTTDAARTLGAGPAHVAPERTAEWRHDLQEAFRAVLARERPSVRKQVLQRLKRRWGTRGRGVRLETLTSARSAGRP